MAADRASVAASLGVSVVTFAPDAAVLGRTLDTLADALLAARAAGALGEAGVTLIDNGPDAAARGRVEAAERALRQRLPDVAVGVRSGHGNVGYGAGHNLAIRVAASEYHLVLNPDVVLAEDAIAQALAFMTAHAGVGLLAPRVTDERGNLQYLCKRYPTPLVLALRGFAPGFVRRPFARLLARYEMRDVIGADRVVLDIPIASGAFMFCRTAALHAVDGFDPGFFLYFEDFDLSLRLAKVGRLAYVPAVRIVHFGGHSARKGSAHVRMFAASALRFFRKHGWRPPAA
jgi:GT2 family glycosyltransferase